MCISLGPVYMEKDSPTAGASPTARATSPACSSSGASFLFVFGCKLALRFNPVGRANL